VLPTEPDSETLIAELRRSLEQARTQAGRLRNVLLVLTQTYNLAEELTNLPDNRLAEKGLTPDEIAALRDVLQPLRNFSWLGDFRVAGCARPLSRSGVEALIAEGVGKVVTLTEDPLPEHWVSGLAIDVEHVPMPDLLPAETSQLRQAVAAIESGLDDGRAVAVQCAAGIGRTGTVLAAFLIARGLSPDGAIETVKRLRPRSSVSASNRVVLARFAHELAARNLS
jgi:atypical dual specificity phosphatase